MSLIAHQDKTTIDPLDVDQWEFFVIPTRVLNERKRSQHSITLPSLKQLTNAVTYKELRDAVKELIGLTVIARQIATTVGITVKTR